MDSAFSYLPVRRVYLFMNKCFMLLQEMSKFLCIERKISSGLPWHKENREIGC